MIATAKQLGQYFRELIQEGIPDDLAREIVLKVAPTSRVRLAEDDKTREVGNE